MKERINIHPLWIRDDMDWHLAILSDNVGKLIKESRELDEECYDESKLLSLMNDIERLPNFENPVGAMRYGRIPYEIHRDLYAKTSKVANRCNPATFSLTPCLYYGPCLGPRPKEDYAISIWIWKGIPEEFRDILFFHELKEAEFLLADKIPKDEAHKRAVWSHMTYAKKFLPEYQFETFLEWQSQFKTYRNKNLPDIKE